VPKATSLEENDAAFCVAPSIILVDMVPVSRVKNSTLLEEMEVVFWMPPSNFWGTGTPLLEGHPRNLEDVNSFP
jgi:hypothetical protein